MQAVRVLFATAAIGTLLLTGCAGSAEESFGEWTDRVSDELGDGYGSGWSGAGSQEFGPEAPGDFEVRATCRGADSATLLLSERSVDVATIDVPSEEITASRITLTTAALTVETQSDADWYVMLVPAE